MTVRVLSVARVLIGIMPVVAVGLTTDSAIGQCLPSFLPYVDHPTNLRPSALVAADFNLDDIVDLAVANYDSNDVSILLGTGDGNFSAPSHYPTNGVRPTCIASADLNGDDRPDLVVANYNSGSVAVLLGNGSGAFSSPLTYLTGNNAQAVALGDVNGDNKIDIVCLRFANCCTSTVLLFLGNGNGTFQTPPTTVYTTGGFCSDLIVEDVNDDTALDILVSNDANANVAVLLGGGMGSFGTAATYSTMFSNPQALIALDVNGDEHVDVVTANLSDTLSILLGDGSGAFPTPLSLSANSDPKDLCAADFDGDGKPDLAVANNGFGPSAPHSASVFLNNVALPSLTANPQDRVVHTGTSVEFSVAATGAGPFAYQWKRDGVPLSNGGNIFGADESILTINPVSIGDDGTEYDCTVSNACGVVESAFAVLNVTDCLGDFNHDGRFDGLDIQLVVNALLAGDTCP